MKISIILICIGVASGFKYNDLRVRYGSSGELQNIEYFYKMPRTISAAKKMGWRKTNRPPGPLKQLLLYCPREKYLCLLYHRSGFVAGLQFAFPAKDLYVAAYKPEKWFVKWNVPASNGEPAQEYWALRQYYVPEDSKALGKGPQESKGSTLQYGGVWVDGPDGKLMRIPSTEAELKTTKFTKQNCITNMGTHYHYNMTPSMLCENQLPWFALTIDGLLAGFGLQFFGNITEAPKDTFWFELFATRQVEKAAVPLGPECLYDFADKFTIFSCHIYIVDVPWNITCRPEDSISPPGKGW